MKMSSLLQENARMEEALRRFREDAEAKMVTPRAPEPRPYQRSPRTQQLRNQMTQRGPSVGGSCSVLSGV
jgi:hypothetical protein